MRHKLLEGGQRVPAGGRCCAAVLWCAAVLTLGLLAAPAQAGVGGSFEATAAPPTVSASVALLRGPACRGASPPAYCGRVLQAGGSHSDNAVSASALYDPKAEAWSGCAGGGGGCPGPLLPGNLNAARSAATMTVLDGPECRAGSPPGYCGKVLAVGGVDKVNKELDSAELYDPATGIWSSCAAAQQASASCPAPYPGGGVSKHTATLLPNGKVLVAGGDFAINLLVSTRGRREFSLYDPATGTWSVLGLLYNPRQLHRAVLLEGTSQQCGQNCGKVLIIGGEGDSSDTSELYDPASNSSTGVGNLTAVRRHGHTATLLPDSKVQVAGGDIPCNFGSTCHKPLEATELFDPATATWTASAPLEVPRTEHAAALLPSGKVLTVAGALRDYDTDGAPNPTPLSAEIYDTGASRWTLTGPPSAQPEPGQPADSFYEEGALTLPSGPRSACGQNCGKVLLRASVARVPTAELFTPTPEMTKLAPASGPAAGGTAVTLEGTALASVTSVKFGALEATSLTPDAANPDKKLVAISPPHAAGTVAVTATSSGGTSASGPQTQFAYEPAPGGGDGGGGAGGGGGNGIASTSGNPANPDNPGNPGNPGTPANPDRPGSPSGPSGLSDRERVRARALRRCISAAARRRPSRAAGSSAKARRRQARLRRQARRACLKRYGRTPGKVTGLRARATSKTEIVLSFAAPGSDGSRAPAARAYLVRQSPSPIRTARDFARAQTLCNGSCRFDVTDVGAKIDLAITDLRPNTNYYYAIAARDNVSGRPGPRSQAVKARTR